MQAGWLQADLAVESKKRQAAKKAWQDSVAAGKAQQQEAGQKEAEAAAALQRYRDQHERQGKENAAARAQQAQVPGHAEDAGHARPCALPSRHCHKQRHPVAKVRVLCVIAAQEVAGSWCSWQAAQGAQGPLAAHTLLVMQCDGSTALFTSGQPAPKPRL